MVRKAVETRRWSMKSLLKEKRGIVLLKGGRVMEKAEKPKVERPAMEEKRGRKVSGHTAEQKCRAVLSVWTERRKPGEICQELGIAWSLLNQWQERAMEGMLLALEPRRVPVEKGVTLNPRLAVLLERKSKAGGMKGLERRLVRLQATPAVKQGDLIATEKKV
jgi:hypothetical protein